MEATRPAAIPEPLWTTFLNLGTPHHVDRGALLWEPGEYRNSDCFVVVHGLTRLYHLSRKGLPVTLLLLGAGSLLGHHPDLEHRPYATGAEALCATQLLALPAQTISTWLRGSDALSVSFADWVRHGVNEQLDETFVRLELEHDSAKFKVAHTLLTLDRQALLDRMSHQHIADIANLSLETTVRSVTQLLREGYLQNSHFTALSDAERLALTGLLEPFEPTDLPYS